MVSDCGSPGVSRTWPCLCLQWGAGNSRLKREWILARVQGQGARGVGQDGTDTTWEDEG